VEEPNPRSGWRNKATGESANPWNGIVEEANPRSGWRDKATDESANPWTGSGRSLTRGAGGGPCETAQTGVHC
jgi:hypothetical protein